jgi:dihydrofolate reductase
MPGPDGRGGGPEIVLIAALAEENRVIGRDGGLPWHIPEDMKRFRRLTTGHALLVGRRTFESVVDQFGGPLPERRMAVLTSRGRLPGYPGVEAYASVEEALEALADEEIVFVGGGETVFRQLLPEADRLELTLVEGEHEGDTFFPPWKHLVGDVFRVVEEQPAEGCRFLTLERADE